MPLWAADSVRPRGGSRALNPFSRGRDEEVVVVDSRAPEPPAHVGASHGHAVAFINWLFELADPIRECPNPSPSPKGWHIVAGQRPEPYTHLMMACIHPLMRDTVISPKG